MATEKRVFVPGNYYHIYNRGNSKQKIYLSESDKNRFTQLLYLCNGKKSFLFHRLNQKQLFNYNFDKGEQLVEICAWVLMTNHFHLLIYIPENCDSTNLSKYVGKLESSYLKYYNQKNQRTGSLFEGRFKSRLVEEDLYLKNLYSYIHLNPLKMLNANWRQELPKIKNADAYLDAYKFSSYHDLVSKKNRPEIKILSNNPKVVGISTFANTVDKLFSLLM